jgi:nickel/cobalt transporter (NiCoT) family protein
MTGVALSRKTGMLFAALIGANLGAWAWALAAFHGNPVLLGTALLAYGFGLRHAVDADHIAAIDNVTRKLMQEGQRPIAVGCFFALGHSTIVIIAATAIAATAGTLQQHFPGMAAAAGVIATAGSALFLFAIAAVNAVVLVGLYQLFRRVRRGGGLPEDGLAAILGRSGLLARLLRRLFRLMSRSWHMYPLGLLFGLGFDTATEIGLLGIAAAEAAKGLPIWSILVFPALFTAAMSLVDTSDGVLMLGAYGWAFVKPLRKLYYNLTITGLSVIVALLVGGIEALGLLADKFGLAGGVWDLVDAAAGNPGLLGCAIIVAFAASWLLSLLLYRLRGYFRISA